MYTLKTLKPILQITETSVVCPVIDCENAVKRQRNSFKTTADFLCAEHGIYISPSTFEYSDFRNNLLWNSADDINLMTAINTVKRESRMARDNSEDAVTWNVIRFMERSKRLDSWLSNLVGTSVQGSRIHYWSYDQHSADTWEPLARARDEFGELPQRGSEPDLIVECDESVFWIEAKFLSGNETVPSDPNSLKRYLTGGDSWYERAFQSSFEVVSVRHKFYELMRLWLLGSWTAEQLKKRFYLVNLVRENKEQSVQKLFGQHIHCKDGRNFIRASWEDAYRFIQCGAHSDTDRELFLAYIENKSAGYSQMRRLQRAFLLNTLSTESE